MKKVGVRQFKDEFYAQIKELPLTVTSRGEPLIVVTSPENKVVTPKKVVTKKEKPKETKPAFTESDFHTCSWNKSFKCTSPGIVKVKSRWFCAPHATQ